MPPPPGSPPRTPGLFRSPLWALEAPGLPIPALPILVGHHLGMGLSALLDCETREGKARASSITSVFLAHGWALQVHLAEN